MVALFALFLLFAFAESATVVPVDSSSINVKHSGKDYSYTINENHGIAIEPFPHHEIPVIKVAPGSNVIKHEHVGPINDQEIKPIQHQIKNTQIAGMAYSTPVAILPAYTYLPAHQYTIPYAYGVNYPYNLIATI